MTNYNLDCFPPMRIDDVDMIDPTFGINDSFTLAKCKRACSESSTTRTTPAGVGDNKSRRTGVRRGQTPSNSLAKVGSHTGSYMYVEQVMTKQHDGSSATPKSSGNS